MYEVTKVLYNVLRELGLVNVSFDKCSDSIDHFLAKLDERLKQLGRTYFLSSPTIDKVSYKVAVYECGDDLEIRAYVDEEPVGALAIFMEGLLTREI